MSDRLRKLDALFAERVLGIAPPHRYRDDPWLDTKPWHPNDMPTHQLMAHYTRSLDAAWEATKDGSWCCRQIDSDYNFVHRAKVARDGDMHHMSYFGQSEDHPAEALVLACLRACGVNEEELA